MKTIEIIKRVCSYSKEERQKRLIELAYLSKPTLEQDIELIVIQTLRYQNGETDLNS